VARGDRLLAYGPSGGGYGDPFRRDPAAVLDNVLDGLFSAEIARTHYGVAITDGGVDAAATERLRTERRAS
jgi:N-methylhydantoinase B